MKHDKMFSVCVTPNECKIQQKMKTPDHYDNTNGSLYKFADDHKLNAYQFEILKRTIRAKKKGEFLSDIDKTIHVLELWREEQGHKYTNEIEILNK